jgi:hypothetical protein
MRVDRITEIGIDDRDRLYIKPDKETFPLIYRTATEVHWNNKEMCLYSPMPREWSYFDWYIHITRVIESECNCKLVLSAETQWTNISDELKQQILND